MFRCFCLICSVAFIYALSSPSVFGLYAGKVTVRELVNLCKKDRPIKPPWVEDEEDRVFEGYESVVEMLEDTGVDTKKVNIYVLTAAHKPRLQTFPCNAHTNTCAKRTLSDYISHCFGKEFKRKTF